MNGCYALIVKVKRNIKNLPIGKSKSFDFEKGFCCYVGSAIGKACLENRIKRHFKKKKKLRWHI